MADSTEARSLPEETNATEDVKGTPLQLRFPTIALDTSFESLLSNSTTSSQGTTIMPPSDATPALDESWASLDLSEFSHDDDLKSENADSASLVDLSSTNGTESAVEDETGSDVDLDEDRATSMIVGQSVVDGEEKAYEAQQENDEYMEDTIILQQSVIQPHSDTVDLEYSRLLSYPLTDVQHTSKSTAREIITMTVSKSLLIVSGQPFNIAYYGAASAQESKDELLGKIGAALVASSSATNFRFSTISPCFNIIPTEFGPGSKPAFADLIPSQAQMAVDEMTVLKPSPKSPASIRFAFKRGIVFESKPRAVGEWGVVEPWRPDLLVLQICREDLADDFFTINEALELATRHFWPVIVVANEPTSGLCPTHFEQGITVRRQDGTRHFKQPIGLDSFVNIDTDQLNHHIKYLINKAQERRMIAGVQTKPVSVLQALSEALMLPSTDKERVGVGKYILQVVEPAPKPLKHDQKRISFLEGLQQTWSTLDGGRVLKDAFLIISVIVLGVYIMSFSQNLSQNASVTSQSNTTSAIAQEALSTATVTATSAVATASASSSEVLSPDHDIVVYDPISFDQVWHRLTGRPALKKEQATADELQSKNNELSEAAAHYEKINNSMKGGRHFDWFFQEILAALPPKGYLNEGCTKLSAYRQNFSNARKEQIKEMHHKLQAFWSDVSDNVQGLGKQTQAYFNGLVNRSQQHLQDIRWASTNRLEALATEQKKILAKAQIQAQLLAPQVPERKKRPFFGKS